MLPVLPNDVVASTCRLGQGEDCCRYLVCGSEGLACAKLDNPLRTAINKRVLSGSMTAVGDNCDGWVNWSTVLGQA